MFPISLLCYAYSLFYYLAWVVGLYSLGHMTACLGFYFYRSFIRKPHDLPTRYGKGSWVVVTGPTAGIGEAYCVEFAKLGFNIVLMGRNKAKLEATESKVLEVNKDTKIQIVEADFSQSMEPEFYQDIYKQIEKLDISILVNNAGFGNVTFFDQVSAKEHFEQISLNSAAPALLTHVLYEKLANRKIRSGIINISSSADASPIPYSGLYASTKRFLTFFSHGLYGSYRDKIDILNVIPGVVTTKLVKNMDNAISCTPEYCVKSTLTSLGHDFENVPYFMHHINVQMFYFYHRFFPEIWSGLLGKILRTMALEEYKEKVEKKLAKNDKKEL